MPDYDRSVEPPAPFLDVVLHHPFNADVRQSIRAKLDTGADISAIPVKVAKQLGLTQGGQRRPG